MSISQRSDFNIFQMSVLIISFLEKFRRGSEIFHPPTSASGLWLRPHMMGRPMARLVAQQARITMKAGEVLCLCWLYRMGEVTAKNLLFMKFMITTIYPSRRQGLLVTQ